MGQKAYEAGWLAPDPQALAACCASLLAKERSAPALQAVSGLKTVSKKLLFFVILGVACAASDGAPGRQLLG